MYHFQVVLYSVLVYHKTKTFFKGCGCVVRKHKKVQGEGIAVFQNSVIKGIQTQPTCGES